ncbi:hypothetical protein Tco_0327069 [Tanacetum coccineum]
MCLQTEKDAEFALTSLVFWMRRSSRCHISLFGYEIRDDATILPPIKPSWLREQTLDQTFSHFHQKTGTDENWGGNGGGQGRNGQHDPRAWATEFEILANLPCKTEEERVVLTERRSIVCEDHVRDLSITVRRDAKDASTKSEVKVIGSGSPNMSSEEVAIKNLLKWVTTDESAVVHDTNSMSTVFVRHCVETTTVKIVGDIKKAKFMSQEIVIDDQPQGRANALNINI